MRTCVICNTRSPKMELTRIVATPSGQVALDPTGKMAGRGAYVCKDQSQHKTGIERGRVEHALRAEATEAGWAKLLSQLDFAGPAEGKSTASVDVRQRLIG